MKRKLMIIFSVFIFLITACEMETIETFEWERLPQGVWMSENPHIVLYIDSVYHRISGGGSFGLYTKNGEEVKIVLMELNNPRARTFYIYDIANVNENGSIGGSALIAGTWRVIEDKLHYTPRPSFQEKLGQELIIFRRLEEYEPINPEDWFP
jgi:hypothetical protein